MPVISPLAEDSTASRLNINADIAAGTIAGALKAAKMIYLSDVPGIMRDPRREGSLIPSVNREKIEQIDRGGDHQRRHDPEGGKRAARASSKA